MSVKNLSDYKKKAMKNPGFKKAYDELELQYKVIQELVNYRIDNNITQDELAKKTGISKSNISRFESGKHSPTLKMVEKIANGLGKKIRFDLTDNDNGNPINA